MTTMARRTDASTSHEAAANHEASGRAATNRDAVLALLERYPGRSSKSLAATNEAWAAGLDRHEVARRLPELRSRGLAHDDGRDETGILWWPGLKRTTYTQLSLLEQ